MRKVSLIVGLSLLAVASTARAQEVTAPPAGDAPAAPAAEPVAAPAPAAAVAASASKLTLGVDAAFQLPLSSNLSDVTGMGFGGLIRAEYNLIPNLNGTLRAGYIYSLKKDTAGIKTSMDNIPIWVGGKYFFTDMVYGGAEVGLNMLKATVEGSFLGVSTSASSTENKFGANVGAGVLLSGLDIRAQLELLDLGHVGDTMALMVNVGYNFFKM